MSNQDAQRSYGGLTSNSYLLTFGATEAEKKAKRTAQQLAGQRNLKRALISMLCAINDAQEESGKTIDFSEFTSQFVRGFVSGGFAEAAPRITASTAPETLPDGWIGTVDHVDPDEVRETLQVRMGNVLDDDDDDLWS